MVRAIGMPEECARLPQITEAWCTASARMQSLLDDEKGIADGTTVAPLPAEATNQVRAIEADPLFQASFGEGSYSIQLVELDTMVAPQRQVNLDFVEVIKARLGAASLDDLLRVCLETRADAPELKQIQTADNQLVFSSPSLDLRFLGGFPKPIDEADIKVAHGGGQPVAVVTLLVGFGSAPVNGWLFGSRVVLANGFHRVFTLRSLGIQRVPIVLNHLTNPEIQFPEQFLGLPRGYLWQYPRPVIVKDFFDQALTTDVLLKPRRKTLRIAWGAEDSVVPE
jgi:hypothetical protein